MVTATDHGSKQSIVFRGAELVEHIKAHLLGADKGFIIFVLEMLGLVGLATAVASTWRGKVVVFITDNDNVKCAINSQSSTNPYVRYQLRILASLGDVFGFRYHATFIGTGANWLEDKAGRQEKMLAARNDDELQAAARSWYGPIFGPEHRMLSVEPLKDFVQLSGSPSLPPYPSPFPRRTRQWSGSRTAVVQRTSGRALEGFSPSSRRVVWSRATRWSGTTASVVCLRRGRRWLFTTGISITTSGSPGAGKT